MSREPVIEVENLWWKYELTPDWILKGINLKIYRGEFVVIVGPNDSGKTTLVQSFNGLIPHFQRGEMRGTVKVLGKDTQETEVADLCRHVGMTFQDPETQFLLSTVVEEISFGPQNLGLPPEEIKDRVEWALKVTRMSEFRKKDPVELSGGQKQRVALAATLAMKPEILILDEPTSMLDPIGKDELMAVLYDLRKTSPDTTFIIVEHHIEELVNLADRFILLRDGKILRDAPTEKFFEDPDFLLNNGVRVPDSILLYKKIGRKIGSTGRIFLTEEEAIKALGKLLSERKIRVKTPVKKFEEYAEYPSKIAEERAVAIEAKDIHYVYPDGTYALRGIDLKIYEGEVVALIGQNGSGKTTLSKVLCGIYKPTRGYVKIYGRDTRTTKAPELATLIGYVFQNPDHQIFNETVRKELEFGLKNLLRFKLIKPEEIEERIKESMKITGIPETILDEHPFLMNKGMRQRIAIASILAMRPKILIVDEPTTGQDTWQSIEVMKFLERLNKQGHTIIIITHEMWVVSRWAKRTIVLAEGKVLLDGPTRYVMSRPDILQKTFVQPPQITRIAQALNSYGIPKNILSVDEFVETIDP